jgi:cellulose synthase/poly-beta-1,6-N-acetylglucosamine synthase-like glycosyltransferase
VSDASTDRTDEIVSSYSDRGVELFRVDSRAGKTAAENAARGKLRGDIVVNTDASVRIHPQAIKALVTMFEDPTVGVASGRDVSTDPTNVSANIGEKGYVGYEMWVRSLETRVLSIVQASGCLYAARRVVHDHYLPESLTRDYASVAVARRLGLRAVSVDDAVCFVPRTRSLRKEYRRKVRTMTRGIGSLLHKADLLNPIRHGAFAWMVFSHKLCRWLVPVAMAAAALALLVLAPQQYWALWLAVAGAFIAALGALGWAWPDRRDAPKLLSVPAYVLVANIAAINGWLNVMLGNTRPVWSPTRRGPVQVSE